ncbi:MAG: NAD-dependent malic enzyme [Candidatus Velthaea sp.]
MSTNAAFTIQHVGSSEVVETDLTGVDLLNVPLLNKGTAFSEDERDAFLLHGHLPPHVGTLEEQVRRRIQALRGLGSDLERYLFVRTLQDTNETLFYALVTKHLEELNPIVYTPTVGAACQRFSQFFARPRGLFLSWPQRAKIEQILSNTRFDAVEAIVVTDGERILGLGDQGAGGMGIPIGKLALYTACAGLHPRTTLPVMLDVGTDNAERLEDPLYIGWRHERLRGQVYDDFIEAFVSAVERRWPHVLLQWEDFARDNAGRLLDKYRDRLCSFNDDIQGTAAMAAGTLLAAIAVTGGTLRDQRIVIFGAGSAGCGIGGQLQRLMAAAGLSADEIGRRFFAVDRNGLLVEGDPDLQSYQLPFVQPRSAVADWRLEHPGRIMLDDVIENVKATVLIGVSGRGGTFTEHVVRTMARDTARPIIFPLSNPTANIEAKPEDLIAWTEGRAIVGTGSPFLPVKYGGTLIKIDQTNNSYTFPGIALGVLAVQARRVSDGMLETAAATLAAASPARRNPGATLLPPVADLRKVAVLIAEAVAKQARDENLCDPLSNAEISEQIARKMWTPVYPAFRRGSKGRDAVG